MAQLDDESQKTVVQGSNRTHGALVACKACESTRIDYTRRSAAERKTSTSKGTAVLYLWEFALLRDNGSVAFLRPTKGSTIVEYYEGLLTDYVRTDYDQVPTYAIVHDLEEAAQYNQAGVEFPNTSSFTLTPPQTLHFLAYKTHNNELRSSATRPPQRVGR